jgi:hypothetical protein
MNVLCALRTLVLTGTALAFLISPSAQAASIDGSFPLNGIGVTQNFGDLLSSTLISMTDTQVSGAGLDDFSPIALSSSFGPVSLNLSSLVALAAGFSLNSGTYGTFQAASALIVQQSANFLDIYFEGLFTPNNAALPGLDPSNASLRMSVNQSGASLSAAMTLTSPPVGVPEPATVSVVAGGLAMLGLAAYRRRAAKN